MGLAIFLHVLIILFLFWYLLNYYFKRTEAKEKAGDFFRQVPEEAKRALTQQEEEALSYFKYVFHSTPQVVRLTGVLNYHGLFIGGYYHGGYYTLNGMYITMTMKAGCDVYALSNYVELATDGNTFVVVGLNETYSLADEYETEMIKKAVLEGIKKGISPGLKRLATIEEMMAAHSYYHSLFHYPGVKLWPVAIVSSLGGVFVLSYVGDELKIMVQLLMLLLLTLFIWAFRKNKVFKMPLPEVYKISGEVSDVLEDRLLINNLDLSYPAHWKPYFTNKKKVVVDVMADSFEIFNAGSELNLVEEKRRFYRAYRKRYGMVFSFLLLSAFFNYEWIEQPAQQWEHIKKMLESNGQYSLDTISAIKDHNWKEGDRVSIEGAARCHWDLQWQRCEKISFHENGSFVKPYYDDKSGYASFNKIINNFFEFESELVLMQGDYETTHGEIRVKTVFVNGFSQMIVDLVEHCEIHGDYVCSSLMTALRVFYNKNILSKQDAVFTEIKNNDELVAQARKRQLKEMVSSSDSQLNIFGRMERVNDRILKEDKNNIRKAISNLPTPVLTFERRWEDFSNEPYSLGGKLTDASSPRAYYQALMSQQQVKLEGMVTNIINLGDHQRIELDLRFNNNEQPQRNALLISVALIVLSLIYGVLWGIDLKRVSDSRELRDLILFRRMPEN